jgi:tetratricopeptide (TPR) repeat protein
MRSSTEFSYPRTSLKQHWPQLHGGDREPYPTAAVVAKLARGSAQVAEDVARAGGAGAVATALEGAWRSFHHGDFIAAIRAGEALGALGAMVANKAAATHTLYLEKDAHKRLTMLRAAIERGDDAVRQLPDHANAHYALALVLGRYSQRISILEALAAGYGTKIRKHLERVLQLEPKHAEAHIALGLYHAELVKTLGSLAARLTYGASGGEAIAHFRQAVRIEPRSVVARAEYAHGLALLDGEVHRQEIDQLYAQALERAPIDRLEELDLERMRRARA